MRSIEEVEIDIPHRYKAYQHQKAFWQAMSTGIKRAFLVWHRRAGKDKTCWNYLISQACRRVGIYWYVLPDAKMARRVVWDNMDHSGFKFLDHIPKQLIEYINTTRMEIKLFNGSHITLLGSHDEDSLRGPNPIGCVFSEYSEHSPKAWSTVAPIFRQNDGWVVFNGTPKGPNHAYELYQLAESMPEVWFAQTLGAVETGLYTDAQIKQFCREDNLSDEMMLQEYYCNWFRGIEGSVYAKYVRAAKEDGRIGRVPYDPQAQVHTAWDIGYRDTTAIVFFQCVGNEIHVIDYYENHGEGLPHYAKVLQDKGYVYGSHYGPSDIEAHHFATGLSAKAVGSSLGIRFVTLPTQRTKIEDGVEAFRAIFPRLWFDQGKCKQFIKALEHYHREFDESHNCYKLNPVHDWSSHPSDAGRYMAIAIKLFVQPKGELIDDKLSEKWFKQYNPLFT